MFRRHFLKMLGCLPFAGYTNYPERCYLYDWQMKVSTDPRFPDGTLPSGGPEVHRVFYNGHPVHESFAIHACLTGRAGWFDVYVTDADGNFVEEPEGYLKSVRYTGHVRYEYYGK